MFILLEKHSLIYTMLYNIIYTDNVMYVIDNLLILLSASSHINCLLETNLFFVYIAIHSAQIFNSVILYFLLHIFLHHGARHFVQLSIQLHHQILLSVLITKCKHCNFETFICSEFTFKKKFMIILDVDTVMFFHIQSCFDVFEMELSNLYQQ